jgi:hypothetical protein
MRAEAVKHEGEEKNIALERSLSSHMGEYTMADTMAACGKMHPCSTCTGDHLSLSASAAAF